MADTPLELIAVEVRADLDQLKAQMPEATRVVDANVQKITQSVNRSERAIVQAADTSGQAMQGTGRNAAMMGAQFSQMGQQVAAGASPLQALAIQLPDISYLLGQTGSEAGALARFFGGPWGVALTTAAAVMLPLIGRLIETQGEFDNLGDAAQQAMAKVRNALSQTSIMTDAATEGTRKLIEGMGKVGQANREILIAEENLNTLRRTFGGAEAAEAEQRRLAGLYKRRDQAQAQVREAQADLNELRDLSRVADMQAQARDRQQEAASSRPRRSGSGRARSTRAPRASAAQAVEPQVDNLKALQDQMLLDFAVAMEKRSEEEWEQFREQVKRMEEFRAQEREKADYEAFRKEEDQVRTVAALYTDLFRGGTDAIWSDFKEIGFRVIAEVLARFTIANVTGGAFNFGDALGSAIGSILPGFATGGSMVIGGRGGRDRNVLSINGSPVARVSQGEQLNITNPALTGQGGGPTIVQQYFTLDARGGITTPELLQYVNNTAAQAASRMGAAVGQSVMKSMPKRMASYQRDGT